MSIRRFIIVALLMLPWLAPFARGPSSGVEPWLTAMLCLALALPIFKEQHKPCIPLAWLLVGLLSSVIALVQYFGHAGNFYPWINTTELGEAFGNVRQRNQFATLLNMALAALIYQVVRQPLTQAAKSAASLAAMLLVIGIAASCSRTGLVQFLLLIFLLWWWRFRQNTPKPEDLMARKILRLALVVYLLASVLLPLLAGLDLATHSILGRLGSGSGGGPVCSSRVALWRNVLYLIGQKPWFGWGWGELDYAHYATLYSQLRFCAILDNAHNLPLHLAVELGIPFAALLLGALVWIVVRAKPHREQDPLRQLAWSALVFMTLHSLLEYPLWYGSFQVALICCLALLWRGPFNARLQCTLSLLVSVVVITFGLSYWRVSQIYLPLEDRNKRYQTDTLEKIENSWFFSDAAQFAKLNMTPLSPVNAEQINAMASNLLHYAPEPRVIEVAIASALLLEDRQQAAWHIRRYKTAFPDEYKNWSQKINEY